MAESTPGKTRSSLPRTPRREGIPWGIVGIVASVVSLGAMAYYYFYHRGLSAERMRILKDRAALQSEISNEYAGLRATLEQWTFAATGPFAGEYLSPELKGAAFRDRPTIYLRLRMADLTSIDAVHLAAKLNALDGLSACLLRATSPAGPFAYGEVVARAEMLGADFTREVKETPNELRIRNLAFALDHYKNVDFPLAREALRLAEYVVIILDEDPETIPATSAAFGAGATEAQRILSVPHYIRASVRHLPDGREILRIRRRPDATLVQVAGSPTTVASAIEIQKVKVLGCAMADEMLEAAGVKARADVSRVPTPMVVAPAPASASASNRP